MIRVRIQGKQYEIASTIQEVDIHKLIKADSEREELAAISDIPLELCRQIDLETFEPLLDFLNNPDDYNTEEIDCVKIDQESTYGKLEQAKTALMNHGKLYRQVYEVSKIYYPKRKKSTDIFRTGVNLISQISLFLEEFAELYEDEPDSQEVQAGVDKINELGAWGTVYVLAGKDLTKMAAIEATTPIEVYMALRYNMRESKYQDQLYKLKYPQK